MLASPSTSYLDLRAPGTQRVKRKPAPSIDLAERYPSPDPSDPFAPLWVLRNRTSSALLDRVSPAFSYSGPYGSQETLENPAERRRSMSYMNPSPLSQNVSKTLTEIRLVSVSPPSSPSPYFTPKPTPTARKGHYMPYSQVQAASATKLQAFPRIATPHASQTDLNIIDMSPKRTAGFYNPTRSSTPEDIDLSDYYAIESDAASSTSEIRFRPNTTPLRHAASPALAYPYPLSLGGPRNNLDWQHAAGSIPAIPNKPKTESKLKLHSLLPAARVEPAHLRFPRFFLPKKRSTLLGSVDIARNVKKDADTKNADTTTTDAFSANAAERRKAIEPRKVHKASISALQAMMSTVVWETPSPPRNAPQPPHSPRAIQHQRSAMLMSTVKQDEDKENKMGLAGSSCNVALIRRSISLDIPTASDSQKRLHLLIPSPSPGMQQQLNSTDTGHAHTKKPNTSERPLLISVNTNNIDEFRGDHHRMEKLSSIQYDGDTAEFSPGLRAVVQDDIKARELLPPGDESPAPAKRQGKRSFAALAQPIAGAIKRMERSTSPALQARLETVLAKKNGSNTRPRHSRMFSFPPISLSPMSPSSHSISGTSIVNISLPSTPTNFEWQHEEGEAFTSPRPAPTPPPSVFNESVTEKPTTKALGRISRLSATSDNARLQSVECQSTQCGPSGSGNTGAKEAPAPSKPQREWTLPTEEQIHRAAALQLTCEDGTRVAFGSLFAAHPTIVVFIRHFWCPLCQDYMSSLKAFVQPEMLSRWSEEPDLRGRLVSFIVISNGAHGMIRKYRQIFGLPFHVYTDPTLGVYKVLGMGRDGNDGHRHLPGQSLHQRVPRTLSERVAEKAKEEKAAKQGGYVKHGVMGGIAMVVVRAIKVGMPVWEKGGDVGQLGGEFIFGPGLTCSFAHRMQTTKGHAPIEDVLEAAGVDVNALIGRKGAVGGEEEGVSSLGKALAPAVGRGGRRRHESMRTVRETLIMRRRSSAIQNRDERRFSSAGGLMMTREEEEEWMAERQRDIEMLQERKNMRRGTSSRAQSSMSSYARHGEEDADMRMSTAILEAVGELSDERGESDSRRESFDSSEGGNESDDEKTVEQQSGAGDEPARVRVPSMMETDSLYSTPTGGGEDARDFLFMDAETESDSWKMEDERNIQPTTSYLFIH